MTLRWKLRFVTIFLEADGFVLTHLNVPIELFVHFLFDSLLKRWY